MLVSNDLCNLNELIISSGRWFSTGPKWIRHLVFHIWHDEVRPTPHFSSSFMTTFQFQWAVQAASSKKLASPTPSSLLEIKERTVHFPNTENNSRLTNPCSNECCMLYTSSDFGLSQSRLAAPDTCILRQPIAICLFRFQAQLIVPTQSKACMITRPCCHN